MEDLDFDLIRPYNFEEIQEAIPRLIADGSFHSMMDFLFTPEQKEVVITNMKKAQSVHEFQIAMTLPAVQTILRKTTNGISHSGFDNINKDVANVYLANHRDIVLDSSILGAKLYELGFDTPHTTWGSNLMASQMIVDLGKSNQMITVFREGSPKELLQNSQRLSRFIRKSILEMNKSVWIAHRKGRSKDGMDKTDVSILKMLTLSGDSDIKSRLVDLKLTPATISYEWEPCDGMKVRETYLSQDSTYLKSDDEDFNSIIGGLLGEKGRIHITMGTPIINQIKEIDNSKINNNDVVNIVTKLIDKQTHINYKLWPSNYLAYDLLTKGSKYSDRYDQNTITKFEERYLNAIKLLQTENSTVRELFLSLYANPVINKLEHLKDI